MGHKLTGGRRLHVPLAPPVRAHPAAALRHRSPKPNPGGLRATQQFLSVPYLEKACRGRK